MSEIHSVDMRGATRQGRFPVYILLAVAAFYLGSRLTHLTVLPIFNDEAVYLHWAQMAREDFSNLWISILTDNKKPLTTWLLALSLNLSHDPLWAGRTVSVVAGFFSLIGVYQIGRHLGSPRVGALAAFLYIVSPYHLFFDRMVTEFGLLNCFFVWTVWLTLALFQKGAEPKPFHYRLLAFLVGFGLLTLSTAVLFVFLPIAFKWAFLNDRRGPPWKPLLIAYAAGLAVGLFPFVILSSELHDLTLKSYFIPRQHSLGQENIFHLLLGIPLKAAANLRTLLEYFTGYLTWPICLLAALLPVLRFKTLNVNREGLILSVYFLLPAFVLLGTAGQGFSRYYLFCATPLLWWAALSLARVWEALPKKLSARTRSAVFALLLFSSIFPAAKFDYALITQPETAPFIDTDRYQYVGSQFSGYGVPEAVAFLREMATDQKITVFTTSNWGNPADAVRVYLSDHPNIDIYMAYWMFQRPLLPAEAKTIWLYQPFTGKLLKELNIGDLTEVYFIRRTSPGFKRDLFIRANPNFKMVRAFRKPGSVFFVEIYKWRGY
ncbi:MAG: ArnT family glycosyltransferase [Nitrospinales bacterium]